MIRVLLADDHHLVREGLRALLEAEDGIELAGEAADGLEVLSLLEDDPPDVLVVDIRMPGLNGLEVTRRARELDADVAVIVLSMYADEAYVVEALGNGASGYVLKAAQADDLITAIRTVADGGTWLSPPLSERSVQEYREKAKASELDAYETLSPREREVLQLAAEGRSNPAIAELLGISTRTVESHRASFMRKLDLSGQTEIVRYALKRGIIRND